MNTTIQSVERFVSLRKELGINILKIFSVFIVFSVSTSAFEYLVKNSASYFVVGIVSTSILLFSLVITALNYSILRKKAATYIRNKIKVIYIEE